MRFESDPSPSPEGVSDRLATTPGRVAGIDPRLPEFEDLAQEAWILRHRWEQEGRAVPDSPQFHRGVLRNLARRKARGEARRYLRERYVAEHGPSSSPSAASLVERSDLLEALGRAMDSLEEPFRAILSAHHVEGLSIAEIAERDGIAADTARWRLRRAHELTREVLLRRDRRGWISELSALLPFGLGRRSGGGVGSALRSSPWFTPALLAGAVAVALSTWFVLRTSSSQGGRGSAAQLAREAQMDSIVAMEVVGEARNLPFEPPPLNLSEGSEPAAVSNATPSAQAFRLRNLVPVLSGTVAGKDRGPIAGAFVSVYYDRIDPVRRSEYLGQRREAVLDQITGGGRPPVEGPPIRVGRTDGSGRFTLPIGLPITNCTVRVVVHAPGYREYMRRRVSVGLAAPRELQVVLLPGSKIEGKLEFPFSESGPPSPFYVWAVPEAVGSNPISLATELREREAARVDDPLRESTEHLVEVAADGTFEITGLDRNLRYWLRGSDPGYRFELDAPLVPNRPEVQVPMAVRPHLRFSREDPGDEPWFVDFKLKMKIDGQVVETFEPFEEGSARLPSLTSNGSSIDWALPLERIAELGYHDSQTIVFEGSVRAWYQDGLTRAELGGLIGRGTRQTMNREGDVWPVHFPSKAFTSGRPLSRSSSPNVLSVVDQHGRPAQSMPLLQWRAPDGGLMPFEHPQELNDGLVPVEGPIRPAVLHVQAQFGEEFGPEMIYAWAPDAAQPRFPPAYLLAPAPGLLQVECGEPDREVCLSWLDGSGGEHEVYSGPVGSLGGPIRLPTGLWQIVELERDELRTRFEVFAAELYELEL